MCIHKMKYYKERYQKIKFIMKFVKYTTALFWTFDITTVTLIGR